MKNPGKHTLHMDWAVSELIMYLPGGHSILSAVQESVLLLLFEVRALKNPGGHFSHSGSEVVEPAILVNLPGGHLVWAVHWEAVIEVVD